MNATHTGTKCATCGEIHDARPLSFDGIGVNSCGVYRTRIATIEREYRHLGPMFAAAPDLFAVAVESENLLMNLTQLTQPGYAGNIEEIAKCCSDIAKRARAAIAKATA